MKKYIYSNSFLLLFYLFFLNGLFSQTNRTESCAGEWVCIIEVETENGIELKVKNKNANPWTRNSLKIEANITNLESDLEFPLFTVVKGTEENFITKFTFKEKGKYHYRSFGYRVRPGDWDSIHDDTAVYELPFEDGKRIRIGQAYNGKVTHQGQFAYAVDFTMPIGTPILAAREGYVVALESKFTEGGFRPDLWTKANFITIQQEDGTIANYAHLNKGGVVVRVGDKVSGGQLIGYSGNTGYTQGPHLHFEVHKPNKKFEVTTVPTVFRTQNGERDTLKEYFVYWKPKPGEPRPTDFILDEDIVLCKLSLKGERTACGSENFKLGESVIVSLDFIQPGEHKIEVSVTKLDGAVRPFMLEWKSRLDTVFEGKYFELVKSPYFQGNWKAEVKVDDQLRKTLNFEVGKN
ncbi:M23 family metallopeptidase [Leptospira ilyithenensis]|uniref:M23 family metallopeptidase n=2 Tax=Leptospira ilyithenensis TaxID=2484901 RepID=A0A4R9LS65_9LEPT|nr:M23 family metallopeptidase [Leptospira ilyithenensis]